MSGILESAVTGNYYYCSEGLVIWSGQGSFTDTFGEGAFQHLFSTAGSPITCMAD